MSQAQIRKVNNAVLDVLGLADMGHSLSAVTVTLHPNSWPTARLELLLHKATGRTERQFVRLVPKDIETRQTVKGFDLDMACDRARAAVAEAIEAKAGQVLFEANLSFSAIRFPSFATERLLYSREYQTEPVNTEALEAFRDYHQAKVFLSLVAGAIAR